MLTKNIIIIIIYIYISFLIAYTHIYILDLFIS